MRQRIAEGQIKCEREETGEAEHSDSPDRSREPGEEMEGEVSIKPIKCFF